MKWLFRLLFVLFFSPVFSQSTVNLSYNQAFVFKHKPSLLFEIPDYSFHLYLQYCKHYIGHTGWQSYWHSPDFIVDLGYTHFGSSVLGNGFALTPGVQFYLKRYQKSGIQFHIASGMAYLNTVYNPISNPLNTAISSHWNNHTKLGITYYSNDFFNRSLKLVFGMAHYSNGKNKLPNSGINFIYAGLSVGIYKTEINENVPAEYEEKDTTRFRRIRIELYAGLGASTSENIGGPQYPVYLYGGALHFSMSRYLDAILGIEREFNGPLYYYYYYDFIEKSEAKRRATKYIVSTGVEMILGNIGIKFLAGVYIPRENVINEQPVIFRLQTNYYPIGQYKKVNPYVGIALKSHYGVADFISYHLGVKF